MPTPEELAEQSRLEQEKLAEAAKLEQEAKAETPQTLPPADPRINALEQKLDQMMTLMQQNAQHVARATVVAPKTPDLPSNKEVWDDPVNAISKIIAAQNAPLNEIAQDLAADRKLSSIKDQIRLTPQYKIAKERYPNFEADLDYQLGQIPGKQLSLQSAAFVMSSVVGNAALSTPNTPVTPTPPVNGGLPVNHIPAHLRPTAPAIPPKRNEAEEPELNENEAILARRYGMSAKEYKAMQNGDRLVLDPLQAGKGA